MAQNFPHICVLDTTSSTSEDECKWWSVPNDLFSWNKWYNETRFLLWLYHITATQCTIALTLCINVSWRCGEPVSCVSGYFAMSLPLHCPKPTASRFPFLAGRAPRLPRWLLFPQDPHTPPPHRPLQYVKAKTTKYSALLKKKENIIIIFKLPLKINASLLICINIFFCWRQLRQIHETMKW